MKVTSKDNTFKVTINLSDKREFTLKDFKNPNDSYLILNTGNVDVKYDLLSPMGNLQSYFSCHFPN